MPRTYSSIDKIRGDLAWVNETPDPNKCGCRNLRCCEETGHKPEACTSAITTKFWTFCWEYYCLTVRRWQQDNCGSRSEPLPQGYDPVPADIRSITAKTSM